MAMNGSQDRGSLPASKRIVVMSLFSGIPITAAWVAGVAGWALAGRDVGLAFGVLGGVAGIWLLWKFPEFVHKYPNRVTAIFWLYVIGIGAVAFLTR